jgi:hypothetical protein
MTEPLVVLLVLVGAAGAADAPSAVPGAVREALATDARVVVEHALSDPPDERSVAMGARLDASAVAEIAWADDEQRRARVHLFLRDDGRWYDREVGFEPSDSRGEKERAVGYVVGAMVRGSLPPPADEPTVPPPAPVAPLVAPEVSSPPPRERPAEVSAPPEKRWWWGVDLAASSGVPLDGHGLGLGPGARARGMYGNIGLVVGAAMRFARVDAAEATVRSTRLSAGLSLRAAQRGERGLELLGDFQAIVAEESVSRPFPPASRSRWLAGGGLGASLAWRFPNGLAPFVGAGLEALSGPTVLRVQGREVGELPPFRAVLELGGRFRF